MGLSGIKWYSEALEENAVFMNDDFYKQRAREVRDIAAKADPFIKQRLLDLADRYDGRRKTSITPFTVGAGCRPEPVRRTRRQFRLGPPAVVRCHFESQQKPPATAWVSYLQPEQIENQPVSPERAGLRRPNRNPFASRLPWPMQNTNAPVRGRDWR